MKSDGRRTGDKKKPHKGEGHRQRLRDRFLADGLGGPEGAVTGVRSQARDLPSDIEAECTEARERDASGGTAHVNLLFRAAEKLGHLLTPSFAAAAETTLCGALGAVDRTWWPNG